MLFSVGVWGAYWGERGGRGHATPRETKKETPGTPHGAYGSLSLPAGDLNEGRSFLNEFRHIPHEVLFCAAHQFTSASPPPQSIPPQNHHRPDLWVPGCSWVSCRIPWRSIFLQGNNLVSTVVDLVFQYCVILLILMWGHAIHVQTCLIIKIHEFI